MRRLKWLAALLILGLAAWGAYYVCNHGFSRHWRVRVSQEFRRRGLDLYVHRLTLDPIQGFVARDVEIFDSTAPDKVLATIDRVALDINFTNLLHGRQFLDAVDMRNANLSLPLHPDDPRSARVQVSQLNARIILPPHEWYVSQAQASIYGIQVFARGRLLNPEAFHPGAAGAGRTAGNHPQPSWDFLKQLEEIHYSGAAPRIDIDFGGDFADQSTLYADVTVWGQKVRRGSAEHGSAELTQVYAALALRGKVVDLKQCNVSDAHGELDASGSYNLDNGNAALQMRSTLDPGGLERLLKISNPVEDWTFGAPPLVELTGSGTLGTTAAGLVTGHLGLGKFAVRGTDFTGAGADFSWDGKRWYVRNGWIGNHTGLASVRALSLPGDFRAQIESSINPNSLRGLFSGPAADALRDWDFKQSPKVSLTVTGTSADPNTWETQGRIALGPTRMRGVPMDWANSKVDVKGKMYSYQDFTIQRDEGAATGSFAYDFDQHAAWMTNIHARLNTTEAAVWVDPDLPGQLAPYRFKTAPDVTLNGYVNCANDVGTHLDVHVDAPGGMDYTFCSRDLSLPKVSGDVLLRDHEIILQNVNGTLSGGAVQGNADIKFGQAARGYTADVEASQVDFASITKLYFNYANSQGLLSGTFDFGGPDDDPATLTGTGQVSVTDGNVFAIPMLGPFSGILNNIVPGMGYNVAHDGESSFGVEDGVITTHDFLVKGLGFNMIGDGRLFFLDDRLNFNIRLNAQGLPGVLLFPVSKLLEYAGTGTLEDPIWKPVMLESSPVAKTTRPAGAGAGRN
jgi:hypothetical protein